MVGGTAPHGRPLVTQEGHVGRAREHGETLAGGERIWYSTVYDGVVCRFMATWRSMATWVKKRRGKCVRKPAEEERGRRGKQA